MGTFAAYGHGRSPSLFTVVEMMMRFVLGTATSDDAHLFAFFAQDHDRSGFDLLRFADVKVFGAVGVSQENVAGPMHITVGINHHPILVVRSQNQGMV